LRYSKSCRTSSRRGSGWSSAARGGPRSEGACGSDLHEGGGHHQELARVLDVQFLDRQHVPEELLGDGRDRDVEHIHLVPLDQVQEQVERAVERVESDEVWHNGPVGRGPLSGRFRPEDSDRRAASLAE
jgi:hypothetical protein